MAIEWHITFLALGIPKKYYIRDEHYCCAVPDENASKGLKELAEKIPAFAVFLAGNSISNLTCISFRIENEERQRAIDHSLFRINAVLDGYCILKEIETPRLAPIVLVRKDRREDLEACVVRDSGWVYTHSKEGTEFAGWEEYEKKFLQKILPFFNIASGISEHQQSELAQQILQSAKAYRAGVGTQIYGIEFLCKFAALEGLVCGSERENKKVLLKKRLGDLFNANAEVEAMIDDIWKRRSDAIHTGRLFQHDLLADGYPLQIKMNDVHYLFAGAFVFALDNAPSMSVTKLWEAAKSYQLPDWLVAPNPNHPHRFALTLWVENTKLVWKGMGRVTDQFFPLTGRTAT